MNVPLTVRAIGWTHFEAPTGTLWHTDAEGGPALVEFAGRACYQSWTKPNPATATNAGYLAHILEVGHLSVLEHGTVTFYLTGVSRSLTHELVRHRHFSYSQLSQRYVSSHGDTVCRACGGLVQRENDPARWRCDRCRTLTGSHGVQHLPSVVEPGLIARYPELHKLFEDAVASAQEAYEALVAGLERAIPDGQPTTQRRKLIRQAARAVLPNATETRIVVTGNYRAWRHFVALRATEHADTEIREAALAILRELQRIAPSVFADFRIKTAPDGTEVAVSPHAERS